MVPIVGSSILLLHESNGRSRSVCLCVCVCAQLQWEPLDFLAHPFTMPHVFLAEDYDFRVFMRLSRFLLQVTSNKVSNKGQISFCPINS